MNLDKISGPMKSVMSEIFGHNWVNDESLEKTPSRFAKYLEEYFQPIDMDKIFGSVFEHPEDDGSIIAQANIPFRMVCEHHLLPAFGKAAIGYIPDKKVIGLSKLTRLVQAVGHERPSLQEHINERIAMLISDNLDPKGIFVMIKAEHSCMAARGVCVANVPTCTSVVKGLFRTQPAARQELMMMIQSEMGMSQK